MNIFRKGRGAMRALWVGCVVGAMLGNLQGRASVWNNAASGGLWSDNTATGWNGTGVPNSNTATADFSTLNLAALNTVHLDGAYQTRFLLFGDTGAPSFGWVLDHNGNAANTLTLSGTLPTITVNNGITATLSARLASGGTDGFAKSGNGTLIISNTDTVAKLGSDVNPTDLIGTLELQAGTYTARRTMNVGGSAGDGTLTINGTASFALGIGAPDNPVLVTTDKQDKLGTINIGGNAQVSLKSSIRAGGSGGGTASARSAGVINITGGTTSVGGSFIARNGGDTSFGTAAVNITGGQTAANLIILDMKQQNGAAIDVSIGGSGTVTATNGVSFTQGTAGAVLTTATLKMNAGGTLRTSHIAGAADQTNGRMVLDLSGGKIVALGSHATFISGFTVAPTIGSDGITFDSNGFDVAIGQAMQGASGKLTKIGAGTVTLSGENTYGGETLVSVGTLNIDGTTGTGMITVEDGATLGGRGTISGATTISGTHTPGNSPGIQTFESGLAYEDGGALEWELVGNTTGTRGTDFDGVDVTGGDLDIDSGASLNLVFNAAGSTVNWSDAFWAENRSWLMMDFAGDGSSAGNFGTVNVSADSHDQSLASVRTGASFSSTRTGDDLYVSYVVPEPATAGIVLMGLAGVLLRRRKIQQA